ncbi:DUF1707 SHOCT-like domain-containing protein [Actinomadura sediminis]|uniref:DUF1707 domain-containing protein n=1 Tax=Actinomadura sediminis TaxID=1038904 RepID=A0ABW3EL18_9ACTN
MSVEHQPLRASDRDRDEVLVRLHTAYAEGRLTETELDERIDLTLAARTHDDLGRVSADLPGHRPLPGEPAGRLQVAYKDTVTRAGRWRVPDTFTSVVYKGRALLDLRVAELTEPVTTLRVVAYKSAVEIVVPATVRVEVSGMGVSTDVHGAPSAGAPIVRVRGIAYKGSIEARGTREPAIA